MAATTPAMAGAGRAAEGDVVSGGKNGSKQGRQRFDSADERDARQARETRDASHIKRPCSGSPFPDTALSQISPPSIVIESAFYRHPDD